MLFFFLKFRVISQKFCIAEFKKTQFCFIRTGKILACSAMFCVLNSSYHEVLRFSVPLHPNSAISVVGIENFKMTNSAISAMGTEMFLAYSAISVIGNATTIIYVSCDLIGQMKITFIKKYILS